MQLIYNKLLMIFILLMSFSAVNADIDIEDNENQRVATQTSSSVTVDNQEDEIYASGFISALNGNKKVFYKKKAMILLADQSVADTIFFGLGGVGCLATAIGLAVAPGQQPTGIRLIEALIGITGIALGSWTIARIFKHFEKKIFIILNKKGMRVWGKRMFFWKDIDRISKEKIIIYTGNGGIIEVYHVYFLDRYGNIKYDLSSGDEHLPITIDNFDVIVNYYWNKYKKDK
jgi:hypothetical protein